MSESKIETTIGLSVVALTRFLMSKYQLNQEAAYRKLMGTELFKLLNDEETRLYLETNEYLCQACEAEMDRGIEALYTFINEEQH
ncbi:MAG: hypothetical protein SOV65_05640 [Phocaeicola vulgatus]|nr:hypothetical protein [Lachnospiraceae bacterium]MDY2674716.1 hypothetical protein [Phocaeicola vulgatus]